MINGENKKIHILVFSVLSVYLFFRFPVIFINRVLATAICISVLLNGWNTKSKLNKTEKTLFGIVALYLTIAFFGFDLILSKDLQMGRIHKLFIMFLCFIWSLYVLSSIMSFLLLNTKRLTIPIVKGKEHAESGVLFWRKWIVLFFVMFLGFFVWQIAYNPVIMSPDSWGYIAGWRSGSYGVNRSPLYAFLINIVCSLAPSKPEVLWIAIIQIIASSALFATVLMYFHVRFVKFMYTLIVAVCLPLIPSLGLHIIVIWCDLTCGLSILWLTYVVVRIIDEVINNSLSSRQSLSLCIQLCISLVIVCFSRPNSFPVYVMTAPILIIFLINRKLWKLLFSTLLSLVIVLLIQFPGYKVLNVQSGSSKMKYLALMHDIHAVYYDGGKFSEKDLSEIKTCIPDIDDPKIRESFQADFVSKRHYSLDEVSITRFIRIYGSCFVKNPFKSIKAMLYRVRAYWVIDPKEELNTINYTSIYDRSSGFSYNIAPEIGVYRKENVFTRFLNSYIEIMNFSLPATFFWRYGVWTAFMVLGILTIIIQKQRIWLLSYAPVFCYIGSLLISNSWTDYRYGLSVFLVGLFLPSAHFFFNKTENYITPKKDNTKERLIYADDT